MVFLPILSKRFQGITTHFEIFDFLYDLSCWISEVKCFKWISVVTIEQQSWTSIVTIQNQLWFFGVDYCASQYPGDFVRMKMHFRLTTSMLPNIWQLQIKEVPKLTFNMTFGNIDWKQFWSEPISLQQSENRSLGHTYNNESAL